MSTLKVAVAMRAFCSSTNASFLAFFSLAAAVALLLYVGFTGAAGFPNMDPTAVVIFTGSTLSRFCKTDSFNCSGASSTFFLLPLKENPLPDIIY